MLNWFPCRLLHHVPCRALASHIPQEGDSGSIPPSSSSSSVDEPVASAASSYEEGPDGVQQWGVMDWPQGTPRRCSWRWRGALTGGWVCVGGGGCLVGCCYGEEGRPFV